VIGIWERGRERVIEHCGGFSKIDAMILEIGHRFRWIPRENHKASIASSIRNPPTLKRAWALAGGWTFLGHFDAGVGTQAITPIVRSGRRR
jgi:hypothetical protein